jgi:Xaa-Pro aminopeptidase
MSDVLIYGDTVRSPALRHEIPLAIIDPFLYLEHDGRRFAVASVLERDRISGVARDIDLLTPEELGRDDLVASGRTWNEIELELCVRACERVGLRSATVPAETPVALADRLRSEGLELRPDADAFELRRRVKNAAEIAGVRRAQTAANAGMAAAAEMLRTSSAGNGALEHDGETLTAERLRARIREVCAAYGAPTDGDIIVAPGAQGAAGHEPGHGPLPPDTPIIIDIWPQDEVSGCFADMTRTFVVGTPADDVAAMHALALESLRAVQAAARAGLRGVDLYDVSCEPFEAAGHPTQRTKRPGETLRDGYFHSLGHGVGLEVHEAPSLGRTGHEQLLAGDVVAVEPGTYRAGYGGVRLEDLLAITEDGAEVLTDFPYDLTP